MQLISNDTSAADLALIFAALALRSDASPPSDYLEAVAAKLDSRSCTGKERARRLVSEAVEKMSTVGGKELLVESIRRIRQSYEPDMRRAFLHDLVELALHDDWYMHEEGRFISAVARRWNVHPAEEGKSRLWSVMDSHESADAWTVVHDLALVYLALAHQADDDLSQRELDAIVKKLAEWLPAALPADVVIIVSESLQAYARGLDASAITAAVGRIKRAVPLHQRAALIADLEYVAEADRIVLVEEKTIIAELARAWGVESVTNPV